MKSFLDESGELESFRLEFDDRDGALDERSREVITAAHVAGKASCAAMLALRETSQDIKPETSAIAIQIFAQSLGGSLGIAFGEQCPTLFGMMITCAKLASMDHEERAEVMAKITEAVTEAENREPRH